MDEYVIKSLKSGNTYSCMNAIHADRLLDKFHKRGLHGMYYVYINGIHHSTYESLAGVEDIFNTGVWT